MPLASKIDSVFQRNMHGKGVVKSGKGIPLVLSNEDMDDIIRITKKFRCTN